MLQVLFRALLTVAALVATGQEVSDAVFSVIPPDYVPRLRGAFDLMAMAAMLAIPLKSWLGDPRDQESRLRSALYTLAGGLDWLGGNTKPIRDKFEALFPRIPRESLVPRNTRVPPLPVFLLCVGLLMSSSSACASIPLRPQAIALDVAAEIINDVRGIIDTEIAADVQHARDTTPVGAQRSAAILEAIGRYDALRAAYRAVAKAKDVYEDELKASAAAGRDSVSPDTVALLLVAGQQLRDEANKLQLYAVADKLAKGLLP